jgi:hypothetical protein
MITLYFTLSSFLLFVLFNESYSLLLRLREVSSKTRETWGRADWVFPRISEKDLPWKRKGRKIQQPKTK